VILILNLMLLVLGLSMLVYGLSAEDEQPEENLSVPRRHIALGMSFTERERIDGKRRRKRHEAEQRKEAALRKNKGTKTFRKWFEKLIMEIRNVQ
jgi:hypothetical protein